MKMRQCWGKLSRRQPREPWQMARCWESERGMGRETRDWPVLSMEWLASSSRDLSSGWTPEVYSNMTQWEDNVWQCGISILRVPGRVPDKDLLLGLGIWARRLTHCIVLGESILLLKPGKKVRTSGGSEPTDRDTESCQGCGGAPRGRHEDHADQFLYSIAYYSTQNCLINSCWINNSELSFETRLPQETNPYGSIY